MQKEFKATPLRQLQLKFGAAITSPDSELHWIAEQAPLNNQQRMEIYQTSWWVRLYESLADDFPAVVRCLGQSEFRSLIQAYLKTYPPFSFTLVHAGDRLPEFLETFEPLRTTHPWMKDLALLERADYQAYHASDVKPWDPNWLAGLTPETTGRLQLKLQPSVTLLKSDWKIAPLLKSAKNCKKGPTFVVIYRDGFTSTYKILKPLQYQLLHLAQRGASLEEWAECAEDSTQWVGWLGEWAQQGIIYPDIL